MRKRARAQGIVALWLGLLAAAAVLLVDLRSSASAAPNRDERVEHRERATGHHHGPRARGDADHDGLRNGIEIKRTRTNWRRADTDRDGLGDWFEVKVTRTNPRKADSDGDGVSDYVEIVNGSDPWNPASVPGPPRAQAPTPPCPPGAPKATTAAAVNGAVAARKSVCVTAAVGDLSFSALGDRGGVVISTEGGSLGAVEIDGTTGLTLRSARMRSVTIRESSRTVIEGSTIGGTPTNRVEDQLIFMPDRSTDVIIRNNDLGWTKADSSGNTGHGCRCGGETDRLQFVGNFVHDLAADGFQGTAGSDVLIDRNRIGPIGANPGSSEHSDNIQIIDNGPNLRITNNWLYGQGYYGGAATGNSGTTYIHGDSSNSLLYENNLIQGSRGRTEFCGLGSGGTSRSNLTIRRNTWVEGGQAFTGLPSFEWDCDSGSGNTVERNIAIDADGGFGQASSNGAASFSANLWGQPSLVTLDAQGNCISANCNPAGQEPIGYRKPNGVGW